MLTVLPLDSIPADPAYEADWDAAFDKVSEQDNPYQVGIQFLGRVDTKPNTRLFG